MSQEARERAAAYSSHLSAGDLSKVLGGTVARLFASLR
jgi:hypothetical protein